MQNKDKYHSNIKKRFPKTTHKHPYCHIKFQCLEKLVFSSNKEYLLRMSSTYVYISGYE